MEVPCPLSWPNVATVVKPGGGVLLFIADAPHSDESLSWLLAYKHRLKREFRQIEIYLAVIEIFWS